MVTGQTGGLWLLPVSGEGVFPKSEDRGYPALPSLFSSALHLHDISGTNNPE